MLFCSRGRRRSRYRYFRRTSSATGVSSATGNGGVFASFRIVSFLTITSTSPVVSFGLTVSAERRRTRPSTPMTYSDRRRLALAISASSSLSNTTCVTPARSRTSTNRSPPRSRTRCTQPSSTASAPTSSGRSAPQVCVRVSSPSCSATFLQVLENRRACRGLVVRALCLCREMLHRDGAVGDLVAAEQRDEGDPAGISVLDLLANLVSVRVDKGAQAALAEPRRHPHRMRHVGGIKHRHHHVGRPRGERCREHAALGHDDQDPLEAERKPARRDALAEEHPDKVVVPSAASQAPRQVR